MKRKEYAEKKTHSAKRQAQPYTARPHKDYGTQYGPSTRQAYASKFAGPRAGRVEVKCLDVQFSGAYADAYTADTQPCQLLNCNTGTACVQSISLVQQGAGISQRIGNKISLKSLRLRLALGNFKAVAQAAFSHVRVMVVYDRNPNTSYVASNAILGESLQSNTIGTGNFVSNLNPNFFDRFVVLMDKQIVLPPFVNGAISSTDSTGCTEKSQFYIDEFIKLKDLECVFNGTANPMTVAFQNTGSLQILTLGDTAAANQPWAWQGTARLRFRDN